MLALLSRLSPLLLTLWILSCVVASPVDAQHSGATSNRHLITYASNGTYYDAAMRLTESALNIGGFQKTKIYTPDDLDLNFRTRNRKVLSHSKGAGYWIFKSYIFMEYMYHHAAEGDILCYIDSLYEFLNNELPIDEWLAESPHIAITSNKPYIPSFPEIDWTKRDTFILMGFNESLLIDNPLQAWGGFICVRKSFLTQQFVSEWFSLCQDARLLMDSASELAPEYDSFMEHRHDQSVISLLGKKWGVQMHHFPSDIVENHRNPLVRLSESKTEEISVIIKP